MERSLRIGALVFLSSLLIGLVPGCKPSPIVPPKKTIQHTLPPPALGTLTHIAIAGTWTRTLLLGAPMVLPLEIAFAPSGGPSTSAPVRLAARLVTSDGSVLATTISAEPLAPNAPLGLTLAIDATAALPGLHHLEFYLVAANADHNSNAPERSPVERIPMRLTSIGTPGSTAVTLKHHIKEVQESIFCDDGRVLLAGGTKLVVLEPEGAIPVRTVDLPSLDRVDELLTDTRCRTAFVRMGQSLVVVDLLNQAVLFEEHVDGLARILFDANPRYVLLIAETGRISRYYMRDNEWSRYRGTLAGTPIRSQRGHVLATRDDERVGVVVETDVGPSLCVLFDHKKVRPHCVSLPLVPRSIAFAPFGFGDEAYAPTAPVRAAIRYEDDKEALADESRVLGSAYLLDDQSTVRAWGLDAGLDIGTVHFDIQPETMHITPRGQLELRGPCARQKGNPIAGTTSPIVPFVSDGCSPSNPIWPSSDDTLVARAANDAIEVRDGNGRLITFYPKLTPEKVLWHPHEPLLLVLSPEHATLLRADGVTIRTPPPKPLPPTESPPKVSPTSNSGPGSKPAPPIPLPST